MTLTDFLVIALSAIIVVGVAAIAVLKSSRHKRTALFRCNPRREQFDRPLSPVAREHFGREWQQVEARFVEDPRNAVVEADRVAEQLLSACGYSLPPVQAAANANVRTTGSGPVGVATKTDFLAAQQPPAVRSYREAHEIVRKQAQGHAHGKELRRAMIDYRIVFEDLVGDHDGQQNSEEQTNDREEVVQVRSAG